MIDALIKQVDADLAAVVEAWPSLPDVVRARIAGIVEGVSVQGR